VVEEDYYRPIENSAGRRERSPEAARPPEGQTGNLLRGIKDKLGALQRSKLELESKINNFETRLKDH
jgi:hypothetical protein